MDREPPGWEHQRLDGSAGKGAAAKLSCLCVSGSTMMGWAGSAGCLMAMGVDRERDLLGFRLAGWAGLRVCLGDRRGPSKEPCPWCWPSSDWGCQMPDARCPRQLHAQVPRPAQACQVVLILIQSHSQSQSLGEPEPGSQTLAGVEHLPASVACPRDL